MNTSRRDYRTAEELAQPATPKKATKKENN
jgi:hypothetical protein